MIASSRPGSIRAWETSCSRLRMYAVKCARVSQRRDHEELAGVAVGLPDLEVDEALEAVDQADPVAEGGDELRRPLRLDPQAGHGDVHVPGG